MFVEAGLESPLAVGFLTETRKCDKVSSIAYMVFACASGDRIAIQLGQPNIDKRDVRALDLDCCERGKAIGRHAHLIAFRFQQNLGCISEIFVIFYK
jgi:hypothetical protein